MAIARNLQGCGIQSLAAQAIIGTIADGQTATGTTQGTAQLISTNRTVFTNVPANSGARLPVGGENDSYIVMNDSAAALKLYPPTNGTINGGAQNAAMTVNPGESVTLFYQDYLTIRLDAIPNIPGATYLTASQLAASSGAALIGYIAGGTGAVATTEQERLRREVYARDYSTGTVNAAAINRAIAYLEANGGGICHLPPGFLLVEAPILITKGVILQGAGIGGAGLGNSGGTVLRAASAAGDIITVSSDGGVGIKDLVIDNPFYTKASGTAGIRLQGSGGSGTVCFGPYIENVLIFSMYDGVVFNSAANATMQKVFIQDCKHYMVKYQQDGATDYGQTNFIACVFWDLNLGTSLSSIYYAKGGDLHMQGCKFLGSKYQFHLNVDAGETGTVNFTNCSFEQPVDSWMRFEQAATSINFGNVIVTGNQFAMSQAGQSCKAGIDVIAGIPSGGASTWIKNISISDSVFNVTDTNAYYNININDGDNVVIADLAMNNNGAAARCGIHLGGNVSTAIVSDNQVDNTLGTTYSATTYAFMKNNSVTFLPPTAGTMNNVAIGGTTPLAGGFTTVKATGTAFFGSTSASTFTIGNLSNQTLQIVSSGPARGTIVRYSNDANAPALYFGKSRGTPAVSAGIVADGDGLGAISWHGDDGNTAGGLTVNIIAAQIRALVQGTPSAGVVGGKLIFSTSTAAGVATDWVTLDNAGTLAAKRLTLAAGAAAAGSAPLKMTAGTNLTTGEAGAVEFDGTNYFATTGTTRYTLAKTLTATATLNFGNTVAGTSSDLTVTVTGAVDGDVVVLGVPNVSTAANTIYFGWVSAANTVTVRFQNGNLVTAVDPASGTFRVSVIRYT